MTRLHRARYAALYGPTTGDRIRLADTNLLIEIEEDRTGYGDEAVRRSPSASTAPRSRPNRPPSWVRNRRSVDTVD